MFVFKQKEEEEKVAAAEEQARLEELGADDSREKEIVPMFFSEMTMDSGDKGLIFKPDRLTFIDSINEVIRHFQDSVLSVENLVPDKYFDAFTSPKINDRYEEKTCGEGPQLQSMFDDDKHLRSIVESIKVWRQNLFFLIFAMVSKFVLWSLIILCI